jgi:hypothetical protein
MNAAVYERLFQLNRCLEQAAELLTQFQQEGIIHSEYASQRRRTVETLRADLSYLVTGLLHRRELEECVGIAKPENEPEQMRGGTIGEP